MKRLVTALVVTAMPLAGAAEDRRPFDPPDPLHIEQRPGEQPFAIIHFTNFEGTRTERRTVETEHGSVVVRIIMTPNRSGSLIGAGRTICCDDELHVIDVPSGVIADPWSSTVPEGEDGQIELYLYQGV